jgi:Trk-type K+ transport system membrane component
LGGIGFPLIYDLMEHHRIKKVMTDSKTQLSLFTKVALLGFIIISVLGFILSIGFEYAYTSPVFTDVSGVQYYDIAHYTATNHEFGKLDTFNRVWAIFFNSMSTRSVGMFTVNSTVLSPGSQ